MVSRESAVSLREVTRETVREICRLKVSEYQTQFVAPNAVSIAQAYFDRDVAWFRAVYADDTPVGFVMLYDNPEKAQYFIWRFMIDERYQKMGFARKAMELVLEYIKSRPNAKEVRLSYHRAEGGPDGFYRKMGFVDTGEMWEDEHVMVRVFR
ncbi:MAG: GNAT family N-acetyltransferase [Bacillota bacterium]